MCNEITLPKPVCSTMLFLNYMGATSISQFENICQRVVSIQPSCLTTKQQGNMFNTDTFAILFTEAYLLCSF